MPCAGAALEPRRSPPSPRLGLPRADERSSFDVLQRLVLVSDRDSTALGASQAEPSRAALSRLFGRLPIATPCGAVEALRVTSQHEECICVHAAPRSPGSSAQSRFDGDLWPGLSIRESSGNKANSPSACLAQPPRPDGQGGPARSTCPVASLHKVWQCLFRSLGLVAVPPQRTGTAPYPSGISTSHSRRKLERRRSCLGFSVLRSSQNSVHGRPKSFLLIFFCLFIYYIGIIDRCVGGSSNGMAWSHWFATETPNALVNSF